MTAKYHLLEGFKKGPCPIQRYKYLIFLSFVFGGSYLVIFINSRINLHFIDSVGLNQDWDRDKVEATNRESFFTIRTKGCTISYLNPFDDKIISLVQHPGEKECGIKKPDLSANNNTHIWLLHKNFHINDVFQTPLLNCCYSTFYRPNDISNIYSSGTDNRVKYDDCVQFWNETEMTKEFVKVSCHYKSKLIYENFHALVPTKPTLSKPSKHDGKFNVLILGIDSISRMNLYRTMPDTLKFLETLDAIELKGYNKVGDNTFPNLVPVLTGVSENELKYTCYPNHLSFFDNCPFIWNRFNEASYVTALVEDVSSLGTFNYHKMGFASTPTDYYLHSFINEAITCIGNTKDYNSEICMGSRFFYNVFLSYIKDFLYSMQDFLYFGFFWEMTMSHDRVNYPMLMDSDHKQFLIDFKNSGQLEKTIFIFMSDHGMRWGKIRQTKQGRLEERLPFLFFVLPEEFKDKYKLATKTLRRNSGRLTTPFDLHETLLDLVNIENVADKALERRTSLGHHLHQRGISLFSPISDNRTCESAGIDDHWCTCHKSEKVLVNSTGVTEAADTLMAHLNDILSTYPQCAELEIDEILEASKYDVNKSALEKAIDMWLEYTVVVRVVPGKGVFESTLRKEINGNWTITGTVSRLNLYGIQSRCVDDYNMKLYCFCR